VSLVLPALLQGNQRPLLPLAARLQISDSRLYGFQFSVCPLVSRGKPSFTCKSCLPLQVAKQHILRLGKTRFPCLITAAARRYPVLSAPVRPLSWPQEGAGSRRKSPQRVPWTSSQRAPSADPRILRFALRIRIVLTGYKILPHPVFKHGKGYLMALKIPPDVVSDPVHIEFQFPLKTKRPYQFLKRARPNSRGSLFPGSPKIVATSPATRDDFPASFAQSAY